MKVNIWFDGQEYPTFSAEDGTWSRALPSDLKDNQYTYKISVTDKAGNQAKSEGQFTVDTKVETLTVSLDTNTDSGKLGDKLTKYKTPTFTGQTEANSTVTLKIEQQVLITKADAKGKWYVTVEKPLIDKLYGYEVTVVDVAGNTKTVTETVTIKTTLPDTIAQLKGIRGFVTNKNAPTFIGKTEPFAVVRVDVGQDNYETRADKNGEWSIQLNELADNFYRFQVRVKDLAGNENQVSSILQIDTKLPSTDATLTEGSDSGDKGDNITNKKSPVLTGKTKPNAKVMISIENENYEITANDKGEWTQALTTDFMEGEHTYHISVTDKAGNYAKSEGTFLIDTEITLAAGLDLSSQSSTISNGITTDLVRPQISGKSDPNSKITGEFKGTKKTVYSDEQGKWSLTFDVNAKIGKDNEYVITAKDAAGNEKTLKQNFSYAPPPEGGSGEAPPPTLFVVLDTESDSGNKGDFTTNVKTPLFIGTATKGAEVKLYINKQEYTATADEVTGKWEILVKSLREGGNPYHVTVEHLSNGKIAEIQGSVTIDTMLPSTESTLSAGTDSGFKKDNITKNTSPVLVGKTKPYSTVFVEFINQSHTTIAAADGSWQVILPKNLKDGDYAYQVSVTDAVGNKAAANGKFTVDTEISVDTTLAPTSLDSSKPGEMATNAIRPQIIGKSDPNSKITGEFKGTTITVNSDENGDWSLVFNANATVGEDNKYTITAKDAAGNEKTIVQKFAYTPSAEVDGGGKPPTLSVTLDKDSDSGNKDDYITNIKKPIFTGTATKGAKITFKIGNQELTSTADITTGKWSIKLNDLSDGGHLYTVTATHPVNGKSTDERGVIMIDTAPPFTVVKLTDATDSGISGDFITKHRKPEFTGKSDPGNKVTLELNNETIDAVCDENGTWLLALDKTLDKEYSGEYKITVTDAANNHFETKGTLVVDNSIPFLSAIMLNSSSFRDENGTLSTNDLTPTFGGTVIEEMVI